MNELPIIWFLFATADVIRAIAELLYSLHKLIG